MCKSWTVLVPRGCHVVVVVLNLKPRPTVVASVELHGAQRCGVCFPRDAIRKRYPWSLVGDGGARGSQWKQWLAKLVLCTCSSSGVV